MADRTPFEVHRAKPAFGLLAARANAGQVVEALSDLANRDHRLADIHGLAIDVWEYLDRLVDATLAETAQ